MTVVMTPAALLRDFPFDAWSRYLTEFYRFGEFTELLGVR